MADLELSDLLSAVRRTVSTVVVRELRTWSILGDKSDNPPPADIDAESTVLSAILEGHVLPSDLAPLASEHFYGRFGREVYAAATMLEGRGTTIDLVVIATELHVRGVRGPLSDELICLRDRQPFCLLDAVRQAAARIIELWRARQLLAQMQRVDADLRLGTIDTDQAHARLREITG